MVEICVRTKFPTRVLVVDDSSTMRSIVRKILTASRFAFDVHEASEGIAALEQLGSGNFGLVFLDYNMPGFNGIETLSEIKRIAPQVSVVMMTSTLDNAIAARARAAGALAFLKKPFYPADIDTVLERHYGLHAVAG
jgi:DNA-binding NtrC family response regulator